MSAFDRSTAVRPTESEIAVSQGVFDRDWQVGGAINGGIVMAAAARGLQAALGDDRHPDPLAVTGSYLSASVPGPLTVRSEVVRRGGSLSTGTATLLQPDAEGSLRPKAIFQAMYGDLAALPDDHGVQRAAPAEMPPPGQCVPATAAPRELVGAIPMLQQLDLRLDPSTVGWAMGAPAHRGMIQAWFKFADGREPDPWSLLHTLDALPPVLADFGRFGWAPTLQLSAYVRAKPAPGWLLVRHETEQVHGGQFEEDARIWDSTGLLVAQGRQLARVPRG